MTSLHPLKTIHLTIVFWVIYLIFISIISPPMRTVTTDYIQGSLNWLSSQPLYTQTGTGFIYFPQAAIFYIPFTKFPLLFSEILWRIIGFTFFAYAIYRFSSFNPFNKASLFFLIISICSLFIGIDTARNGQFNIIIVDFMLLAVVEVIATRWWLTALYLVCGLALKPTMIVLLLLLTVLYRPLWWRVPILLLSVFLFPFLMQSHTYVMRQYIDMYNMLFDAANLGSSQTTWAQLFGLVAQTHYVVSVPMQNLIRLFCALATFLLALKAKKTFSPQNLGVALFTLAALYLMLFNPRTENNDYIILAPAIGYFLAVAICEHNIYKQFFLGIIFFSLVGSHYLSQLIVSGQTAWVSPLAGLLFGVFYMYIFFINKDKKVYSKLDYELKLSSNKL